MPTTIRVAHRRRDQFEISVRQHVLHVDQPTEDGGDDTSPTPTELFVAGLASCVAFYARRFLARHDLPTEGLAVQAAYTMASGPTRVGAVSVLVRVPDGVPADRRAALLAVASHCTVHNSLTQAPVVHVELTAPASSSAA